LQSKTISVEINHKEPLNAHWIAFSAERSY